MAPAGIEPATLNSDHAKRVLPSNYRVLIQEVDGQSRTNPSQGPYYYTTISAEVKKKMIDIVKKVLVPLETTISFSIIQVI